MKVVAINGSPRKKWNTAMLLEKALEGAASRGAETELIHLYELTFTGCISCFACKTKGGKSYGKCAVKDGLTEFLDRIEEIDGLVLGSPIYLGTVTGEMKSFTERLLFPFLAYAEPPEKIFMKKIATGSIYTMNASEERIEESWDHPIVIGEFVGRETLPVIETYQSRLHMAANEYLLKMIFGSSESMMSCQTYQFEDYTKVVSSRFDPEERAKRRREVFPKDCEKALQMGVRLASPER